MEFRKFSINFFIKSISFIRIFTDAYLCVMAALKERHQTRPFTHCLLRVAR